MKFFSKLKVKRMQIIAAAVFASGAGLCHAAVTLPAVPPVTPVTLPVTFAAGTPAKAADVNADFQAVSNGIQSVNNGLQAVNSGVQAVNNGLPSFLGSSTTAKGVIINVPATAAGTLTSFVVTTTSAGSTAEITASGVLCAGVTVAGGVNYSNTESLQITVDGVAAGLPFSWGPSSGLAGCTGFNFSAFIQPLAAGSHTIAVQGVVTYGSGTALASDFVLNVTLSGVLYH